MDGGSLGKKSISGLVAVVTGSTQGIGAGIARRLGENGARVVIHGLAHQHAKGERVCAELQARGASAILVTGNLKEEEHCLELIQAAIQQFGAIDILVNNAGNYARGDIESTSVALWDEILAVNLRAPFILCQEAVRDMKKRRSGCIVNIGSVNAYTGLRRLLAYSVAKGGLMTFTRNLANDVKQYRIRVNQINPGWTFTEGEDHMVAVLEGHGSDWLDAAEKKRPFGRLLRPEDIAEAVLFFAGNEMITGAVLDYDQLPLHAPPEL
jgi:NAD(P)-dependent dehydrogenase (short-subunit alcohol dehydrogenase family)